MTETNNKIRFAEESSMNPTEKPENVDLINWIAMFSDLFEEMNDLVQNISGCVVERLVRECNFGSQTDHSTENSDEPVKNQPVALGISPEGIATAMPINGFFEVYDWFADSEVAEPVPGIPGVYMTYDRSKLIVNEEHGWLPDDVVVYRADNQNNVISLSGDDMYNICDKMKLLVRVINNSETNEEKVVFALR